MYRKSYREFLSLIRLSPFDASTPEGRVKERYRRIALNTIASILARLATALAGIAVLPMLLNYLDKHLFGMWTTITASVTWFTLFDLGLVNGLVNVISEAYGKDDQEVARGYVSTTFIVLVLISSSMTIAALTLSPHINWRQIFAIGDSIDNESIRLVVLGASLPIIIGMPLSIVRQIDAGYQNSYVGHIFSFLGSIVSVIAVYIAIDLKLDLHYITTLLIGIPILAAGINIAYLFKFDMPWLRPKLSSFGSVSLKRLLSISVPLFLFQIGALLVNQTQPIILAHRAGLTEVALYAVAIRIYQAFMSVIAMSTIAFVPSFREATERGDHSWVTVNFKRMLAIRLLLATLFSFVMIFFGNFMVEKWLGRTDIVFSLSLWIILAFLMLSSTWSTAYSDLLIIMDKIWIQVVLVSINGISILGLTYVLSPHFGISGAIIATTCFTVSVLTWILPMIAKPFLVSVGDMKGVER